MGGAVGPGGRRDQGGAGAESASIDDRLADFESLIQENMGRFLNADFQGVDPTAAQGQLGGIAGQLGGLAGQAGGQLGGFGAEAGALRQGAAGQFGDIGSRLLGISEGVDPRFAAFREGEMGLLEQQRQGALESARGELSRQGIGGTAALNDLARINAPFQSQQRALSGQIGIQEMGRQDQALLSAANVLGQGTGLQSGLLGQQAGLSSQGAGLEAGLLGQQAGVLGQQFQTGLAGTGSQNLALQQELDALGAGLTSAGAPVTLDIAQLAAKTAGEGGGGGGGKGGK